MKPLAHSELIINPDGTVYHLNLKPGDIANTIITVGDPDRVSDVSKHFDSIEVAIQKREFKTHTGLYQGKRITVISTGIGTDNIDIVFNELDALVNVDFETRTIKETLTSLHFIRIGTSGAIQKNIAVNSFLISEIAIGFDSLVHFYQSETLVDHSFSKALVEHTKWNTNKSIPYVVNASTTLSRFFDIPDFIKGCTVTNVGFYGPQGRVIRLAIEDEALNNKLESFSYKGKRITNLEMETAGIYGLAALLGHQAVSLNAILANRATGEFSEQPNESIARLIATTLQILVNIP